MLGDKSFIQEDSIARVYPNGNLFSHVIGQIDNDNNGISGIEKTFDYELTTTKEPLKLTLDKDLQYLIKEELSKSKDIFQNIGSAAILMDINNGEIISIISLPDFDPNKRRKKTIIFEKGTICFQMCCVMLVELVWVPALGGPFRKKSADFGR